MSFDVLETGLVGLVDRQVFVPFALLVAVLLGAAHACAPGHGKTLTVGYLVGYLVGGRARRDHDASSRPRGPAPTGAARPRLAKRHARRGRALDATVRLGADLAAVLGTEIDVVDRDGATLELRGQVAAEEGRPSLGELQVGEGPLAGAGRRGQP
jgi:hypothetical protein